jgi:hypothetical protein
MNGNSDSTIQTSGRESGIRLPIATLAPDPRNPRKMTDEARAGLGVSLETFGALDIVFNDETGETVSGHQRIAALKAAGATTVTRDGDWGFITLLGKPFAPGAVQTGRGHNPPLL